MRALVQRVVEAEVVVDGGVVGRIGEGLVVLVGVGTEDTELDAEVVAAKIANLRLFADERGTMNRSILEMGGAALVVSQFTLYADVRKGRRPSWAQAAPAARAEPLVELFGELLRNGGVAVSRGSFGAHMTVNLTNDGPVTVLVESLGGRLV